MDSIVLKKYFDAKIQNICKDFLRRLLTVESGNFYFAFLFLLKLTKAQRIDGKVTMRRLNQSGALTDLKKLIALVVLAREMQCITPKENRLVDILKNDVKKLLEDG